MRASKIKTATPPKLLELFDQQPPFFCYYCAHFGRDKRPKRAELSAESGIPITTFTRIAYRISWVGIRIEIVLKFAEVCGINLLDPKPAVDRFLEEIQKDKIFAEFETVNVGRGVRDRMLQSLNKCAGRAALKGFKLPEP